MKQKINQLFRDKLILVMLVLGLLTIVSAAGVMKIRDGRTEESPYLNMEGEAGRFVDEGGENSPEAAGDSQAARNEGSGAVQEELADAEDSRNIPEEDSRESPAPVSEKDGTELAAAEDDAAEEAAEVGAGQDDAASLILNFAQTQSMMWPAEGNVLLDYSMDTTVYFPTLEQYKCSPGMVIQSDVSQPVSAPADARVLESANNEEIGNYLVLDLGDGYTVTCGQLKEVRAEPGEYLEKGQVMGYVAEPTKYYTLEGPNLYLEMTKDGTPVDPLDYLE